MSLAAGELLPITRADVDRLANREKLEIAQRQVADLVAERRTTITSAGEADALRRELGVLIKAFHAKRIPAKECQAEERRYELLIGKLLGRAKRGRPRKSSSDEDFVLLHDQYRADFRAMAEAEEVVEELLANGKTDRKPIVRTIRHLLEKNARESAKISLPQHEFVVSACRELQIEPGSVDVVITDPPYPREHLAAYSELSEFAASALRDGGLCVALAGQSYLPEVLGRLGEHLRYHWLGAYLMPGGQSSGNRGRGVNAFWKPVCIFAKGKFTGSFGDVVRSKTNDNDAGWMHEWGQSESGMLDLVEHFSRPGDLIADPFLGSGTIALVALLSGRRFIGADIDEAHVESARLRIG